MPEGHYYHQHYHGGGESSYQQGGSGDGGDNRKGGGGDKRKGIGDFIKATKEALDHRDNKEDKVEAQLSELRGTFQGLATRSYPYYEAARQDVENFRAILPNSSLVNEQTTKVENIYNEMQGIPFEGEWNDLLKKQKGARRYKKSFDLDLREQSKFLKEYKEKIANLIPEGAVENQWQRLRGELAEEQRTERQKAINERVSELQARRGHLTGWTDHYSETEQGVVNRWFSDDAYNRSGLTGQQTAEITSLKQTQYAQGREFADAFNADLAETNSIIYSPQAMSENRDLLAHELFLVRQEAAIAVLESVQNTAWQELRTRQAMQRGQSAQPPAYDG